jgi:hypothetical protein
VKKQKVHLWCRYSKHAALAPQGVFETQEAAEVEMVRIRATHPNACEFTYMLGDDHPAGSKVVGNRKHALKVSRAILQRRKPVWQQLIEK